MGDGGTLRRVAEAYDLAARAHEGQSRKAGRREAYVSHVVDVARRVAQSEAADEVTLVAAILHDVPEKTDHPLAEVEARFGSEVAGVVAELTDDPALSEEEARRAQVEAAPGWSDRAKRIKLADKASKLASIAEAGPGWRGRGAARDELEQARRVAAGLRGVDARLEADFDREAARVEAMP